MEDPGTAAAGPRRFDATTATCRVLTFREGVLSPVGHDLELAVTRFELEIDEGAGRVSGRFDPASLRVTGALSEGRVHPDRISPSDRGKIEAAIAAEVLEARRYPSIEYRAERVSSRSGGGAALEGMLTLHGRTRLVPVEVRAEAGARLAEVRLHQPDFGIRPYRALLGALRVQAEVLVRISVPWG